MHTWLRIAFAASVGLAIFLRPDRATGTSGLAYPSLDKCDFEATSILQSLVVGFGTDHASTHQGEGAYHQVREASSGGDYRLDSRYRFSDVGPSDDLFLFVKAYTTGERFRLRYSTDGGATFQSLGEIANTSDDGTYQALALPHGLSGTIWIRIHDLGVPSDASVRDSVFVDHMVLAGFRVCPEPTPPPAPTPFVWHVRPDGDDDASGDSWESAFGTLQRATQAALDGHRILVAEGTYAERATIGSPTKRLEVFGGYWNVGTSEPLRDPTGRPSVLRNAQGPVADNYGLLDGFDIEGATSSSGSSGLGVRNRPGATLSNCRVRDNITFSFGSTLRGGGVYNEGTVVGCEIVGNGLTRYRGTPQGGGIYNLGTVLHCTVSGNGAGEGGGIFNGAGGTVRGTIAWGNFLADLSSPDAGPVSDLHAASGSLADRSIFHEASGGTNLSADPLFENAEAEDFRLRAGSPAIDAADGSAPDLPATDLAGNPRAWSEPGSPPLPDIGARERVAPPRFRVALAALGDRDGRVFGEAIPPRGALAESDRAGGDALLVGDMGAGLGGGYPSGANAAVRSVAAFDASAIPAGSRILSARFELTRGFAQWSGSLHADFGSIVLDVGAGAADETLDPTDYQRSFAATAAGSLDFPEAHGETVGGELDAVALAALPTGPDALALVRVRFGAGNDRDATNDLIGFHSGEAPDPATRPRLIVEYEPLGPIEVREIRSTPAYDGWAVSNYGRVLGIDRRSARTGGGAILAGDAGESLAGYPGYRTRHIVGFLDFDTSTIAADANVLGAELLLAPGAFVGDAASVGDILADVRTGHFGAARDLDRYDDYAAPASAEAIAKFPPGERDTPTAHDLPGIAPHLNRAGGPDGGITQFRLRPEFPPNGDGVNDRVGFHSGENATLGPRLRVFVEGTP